jgi:hypothetical protein
MTALAADRNTTYREGVECEYPVKAATQIYAGSLVMLGSDGYAIPGADTAGAKFVGVAVENVLGGTTDGAKKIRVRRKGVFEFAASSITQAMLGDIMYLVDDQTFDDAAGPTNDIPCGRLIQYVSATKGWIDIGAAWIS